MPIFLSAWPFIKANERGRYTPLGKESYPDEAQPAIPGNRTSPSLLTWRCVLHIAPWLFTMFLALSTTWLLFERSQRSLPGTFATGWATDFGRVPSKSLPVTLGDH